MPVLSLACHLRHNTPNIPSRCNNEQTTKQTKAINNSYIYINISCKCDTNRAGHFTLDAYASRPVACVTYSHNLIDLVVVDGLVPIRLPAICNHHGDVGLSAYTRDPLNTAHAVLTLYVLFFFRDNINIYSYFMSFLHTNKTQVVEIPPRVRQGPAYST